MRTIPPLSALQSFGDYGHLFYGGRTPSSLITVQLSLCIFLTVLKCMLQPHASMAFISDMSDMLLNRKAWLVYGDLKQTTPMPAMSFL